MSEFYIAFGMYALIALVTIIIGWLRSRMLYWRRRGVPHTEPGFLVGNLAGALKARHLSDCFQEAYDKFKHGDGPFCGFYFYVNPAAIVTDLDLARNILIRDCGNFDERGVCYNERDDPLTAHLLTPDAEQWRELRGKFTPVFSADKMKQLFPLVVKIGKELVNVCDLQQNDDSEIDMLELLARYTTDVTGTCIFGRECNSLLEPEAEFRVLHRVLYKKLRRSGTVRTFMQCFPKLARLLRLHDIRQETQDFYARIVRQALAMREQDNIKRNDFLDVLIELKNSRDAKLLEVATNAYLSFAAGCESSATTMAFALHELAQHQQIQTKLRAEIVEALERHNGVLTQEALQEMRYLDQVLAETLRKYAVLPFLQRIAHADYETSRPGYVIEKGTMVIIPIHAIQHDSEVYPEPQKFLPERFDTEEMLKRHPVAWLPFGDGPRNCLGMRFGQLQSRIGLAALLKDYKFTPCQRTPTPMVYNNEVTMLTPKDGMYLRVEKL